MDLKLCLHGVQVAHPETFTEDVAKLLKLQQKDGSWVNDNNRFWENDPVLVTSFAVLTLSLCK